MVLLQKVINDIEFAFWIFRHRRNVRLTEIIRNTSARGEKIERRSIRNDEKNKNKPVGVEGRPRSPGCHGRTTRHLRSESRCAHFCAHPRSKTVAIGSSREGKGIACTGAENQRGSKQSQSILIVFARSLNQRVAGSSPARFTTHSWVRPGDIGNSLYRRHGLHFWAERVFEWFEHPCPDDVLLPAVPPKSPLQGLL